ncbi:MAG TPA: ParA family protein [Mycobacteriales bacterium]|nr:ParA family protein [Mycobacteriales bacterium]
MRARVICVASAKGGSGKTLLTATFGTFLGALGKRVLLVDTDAATNGLSLLYLRELTRTGVAGGTARKGLFEDGTDELTPTGVADNVDLLPATYRFTNSESVPLETYRAALLAALAWFGQSYDYVFLDAQAGTDEYAEVAVRPDVSDEVVIVTEYDPVSAAGVERLKAIFGDSLAYPRTWILLNKMLPDFVSSFSEFLEIARYLSPVPWDAQVVRAYARRSLALDTEHGNDHTLAVLNTLRGLLGDEVGAELDQWIETRAEAIREPVRDQIAETRAELDAVTERQHRLRAGARRRLWMSRVSALAVIVGAGAVTTLPTSGPTWVTVLLFGASGVVLTAAVSVLWSWSLRSRSASELDADRLSVQRELLVDRLRRLSMLEELRADSLLGERERYGETPRRAKGR